MELSSSLLMDCARCPLARAPAQARLWGVAKFFLLLASRGLQRVNRSRTAFPPPYLSQSESVPSRRSARRFCALLPWHRESLEVQRPQRFATSFGNYVARLPERKISWAPFPCEKDLRAAGFQPLARAGKDWGPAFRFPETPVFRFAEIGVSSWEKFKVGTTLARARSSSS